MSLWVTCPPSFTGLMCLCPPKPRKCASKKFSQVCTRYILLAKVLQFLQKHKDREKLIRTPSVSEVTQCLVIPKITDGKCSKSLLFFWANRWRYTTHVWGHLMRLFETYTPSKLCWHRWYSS